MKKQIIIYSIVLSLFCGCKTTEPTLLPQTATAVLVGIGFKCDKKEIQKKGADLDIRTMYETVRYAYNDNYLVGLQKPNCTYKVLQDHNATTYNVKSALQSAINDELAILYFSCKSLQLESTDQDEIDDLDECLQLYDGILRDNEIWEIISQAKGRVFIIFDTSNSSSMFKSSMANNIQLMNIDNKETSSLNITCWSACLDNEVLPEKGTGGKLTTYLYYKYYTKELTYQQVFDKILKSLSHKQNINKTVIGEDFSNKSMFR